MIRSPCAAFKKAVYDIRGLRSYPRPQEAPLAVILSRRGEILNLEWDQVDLGQRQIVVRKTKSGKDGIIPINTTVGSWRLCRS